MKRAFVVALASLAVACGSTPARSGTSTATTTGGTSANGSGSGNGNGSGSSSNNTNATGSSGSGATTGSSGSSGASGSSGLASSGSGNGSTTGNCYTDTYVGLGNGAMCCSGQTDASGYCIPPGASTTGSTTTGGNSSGTTGTSSTTGTGSTTGATSSGATGTTTGGTCPNNVPNLVTGQGGHNAGTCSTDPTKPACPKGYHCDNGQCTLNTSSTLQVTLSFDDTEDFDLHLMEPLGDGGYCEIYYGNPGNAPDSGFNFPFDAGFGSCPIPGFCSDGGLVMPGAGNPCPAGWLDLDTNAACGGSGGTPDGVNIENILFSNTQQPPSGTYYVRVDYWEECDSITSSNLSVQVRLPSSAIYQYCPAISVYNDGPNDQGDNGAHFPDNGNQGSGFMVTSFTIP